MWADADRMTELYAASEKELSVPDFVPNSPEVLAEGKRLFELFCDHCHGKAGLGDGPISKMEKIIVPSFAAPDRIDLPYGKMYFSITYGKGAMGPHASQVNAEERWKLVRYIRSLQGRSPEKEAGAVQAQTGNSTEAGQADASVVKK
jgi:mono/diheme cytochrome c family protein